jgi:hypothetical protein
MKATDVPMFSAILRSGIVHSFHGRAALGRTDPLADPQGPGRCNDPGCEVLRAVRFILTAYPAFESALEAIREDLASRMSNGTV